MTSALMRVLVKGVLIVGVAGMFVAACYIPTEPETNNAKCSPGYCYIRSAYTCCPSGYLNYAGAGAGCFSTRSACLTAGGGKCWYETSCIP